METRYEIVEAIFSIGAYSIFAGLGWPLLPLAANAQEVTTIASDGTGGFLDGTGHRRTVQMAQRCGRDISSM